MTLVAERSILRPTVRAPNRRRARSIGARNRAVRGRGTVGAVPIARALWATAGAVLVATLSVAWAFTLRPASLGGPAQYVLVKGVSMLPTFETGDLVITRPAERYRVGDVVAYRVPEGDIGAGAVVLHRIVGGSAAAGYRHPGRRQRRRRRMATHGRDILGKAWIHAPGVGRALTFLRAPVPLASLAAGFTIAFVLFPSPKRRRHSKLSRARSRNGDRPRRTASSARPGAARPGRTRGHRRRPSRGSRRRQRGNDAIPDHSPRLLVTSRRPSDVALPPARELQRVGTVGNGVIRPSPSSRRARARRSSPIPPASPRSASRRTVAAAAASGPISRSASTMRTTPHSRSRPRRPPRQSRSPNAAPTDRARTQHRDCALAARSPSGGSISGAS